MNKKTRFCANCGKETSKLINNICPDCYSEIKEIKLPKRIIQKVCSKCGAIFSQGLWIKTNRSLEASLSDKLSKKLRIPDSEEVKKIELDLEKSRVKIKASVLDKDFDIDEKLKIELKKQFCKGCRELEAKKHTVKIQLRFSSFSRSLIKKATSMITNHKKYIKKVEERRRGLDIFLRNKGVANTLARKLAREFGCKMSRTIEQYSWNKDKNRPLTRHSILLKQIKH